ncbi:MAG: hypothetical protein LBQ54_12300 [Planctomycetaceae bacterium]|nr:hypothetical protein [Planctomycetaceae bacterium]
MSYPKYGLLLTLFFYAASQGSAFSQVVEVISPPVLHPVTNAALPRTPYAFHASCGR